MKQRSRGRLPVLISLVATVFLFAAVACFNDDSDLPAGMVGVHAPIKSVEITKAAAKSPNSAMVIVTGLRNGCELLDGHDLQRDGDLFTLTISNLMIVDPERACTDDSRTVTTNIPLDAPIEECKQYIVEANGVAQDVLYSYTPFMESDTRVCES